MIPKVIHYCWLSGDPYPKDIARYMGTWHEKLRGYELQLWDFERFPRGRSAWVDQAFDSRKYAFAADYIRCYALYHHGGIYLDTDVEVLNDFDTLLHLPYFICYENGSGFVEAGIMASEQGNDLYRGLLDFYDNTPFDADTAPTLPRLITRILSEAGREIVAADDIDQVAADDKIHVLPYDFFSPIHNVDCRMMRTPRTYTIHHFAGSWNPWYRRAARHAKELMGPHMARFINRILH